RSLAGDALFSPYGLVILIAELIARIDAANHANNPIPSSVITGEKANRPSEVGTVNLIGLGTQVIDSLRRITIISYFQDNNTGSLVTMAREHSLSGELVSYAELANRPFSKTLSLATLGLSRVIASGGRITASRCYAPGRSPLNSNPQNYQWESVRTPIRVENFAELSVQLSAEFPRYLSGRQAGRHLKVCKIQAQGRPYYDQGQQLLSIPLLDEQKEPAILSIPYRSRASFGFEKLVEKLSDEDNQIRFISGIWSMAGNHLSVLPVTIIFEKDGSRWALQPDIETGEHIAGFGEVKASGLHRQSPAKEILNELGVLFTTGLSKAKADDLRTLRLLQQQTEAEGCLLLSKRLEHFLKIALSSIERKNLDALTGSALSLALVSFVMEETAG
ncbi:MAG TPA: hypothetical protein PKC93_09230, partial [Candidatus Obscuribacter sp.]|nr:hypothetical protein [Candidatus Obscuribacter sp.]